MNRSTAPRSARAKHHFAISGFLFGLLFPITGIALTLHRTPRSIPQLLQEEPLLWLLAVVPFVCALAGRMAQLSGNMKANLSRARQNLMLGAGFAVLFLLPISLAFYAVGRVQQDESMVNQVNLTGLLRLRAMSLYVVTTNRSGGDPGLIYSNLVWTVRELNRTQPQARATLGPAWEALQRQYSKSKRVSWDSVMAIRSATDDLNEAILRDVRAARKLGEVVLISGALAALLAIGIALSLLFQNRLLEESLQQASLLHDRTLRELDELQRQREQAQREAEESHRQREQTATRDPLTGLYNRRAFEERLTGEWARSIQFEEPLSLILLDIDQFQSYNDSFGTPAGDSVLSALGKLLQHGVRATDMAVRYDGARFLLMLPHTPAETAFHFAERLRAAIQAAPWKFRSITVSMGVATRTAEMRDPNQLLAQVDVALYQAKKTRNQVCSANPSAIKPTVPDRRAA